MNNKGTLLSLLLLFFIIITSIVKIIYRYVNVISGIVLQHFVVLILLLHFSPQ